MSPWGLMGSTHGCCGSQCKAPVNVLGKGSVIRGVCDDWKRTEVPQEGRKEGQGGVSGELQAGQHHLRRW